MSSLFLIFLLVSISVKWLQWYSSVQETLSRSFPFSLGVLLVLHTKACHSNFVRVTQKKVFTLLYKNPSYKLTQISSLIYCWYRYYGCRGCWSLFGERSPQPLTGWHTTPLPNTISPTERSVICPQHSVNRIMSILHLFRVLQVCTLH